MKFRLQFMSSQFRNAGKSKDFCKLLLATKEEEKIPNFPLHLHLGMNASLYKHY